MKSIFKWLALGIVVIVVALALARAWLLHGDEVPPPDMPGELESGVLVHDGHDRNWLAYVPASLADAPALLIVLRGSRSDGAMARSGTYYSFDVLAERNGSVVAYPSGFENHWNDCRAGASFTANQLGIDDVGFLRSLVDEMVSRYGIDPRRVFVAGLSNGGHMAYRLAYEAPDLIAGAAVVIANLPAAENSECKPSAKAVPMLIINGTEDPINPYRGGLVNLYGDTSRGTVLSARDSVGYWADLAGYINEGQAMTWPEKDPDDNTSIESLSWAEPGKAPVSLISVIGGGHTFPNPIYSAPRILGATSHEADAAELIWDFFEKISDGITETL